MPLRSPAVYAPMLRMRRLGLLSLDANAEPGTGGASPRGPAIVARPPLPRDIRDIVVDEFARNPVAMGKEILALRRAGAVPEGGRVLTKEERARFDAYEALGAKPDDLKSVITERDTLKAAAQARAAADARATLGKTAAVALSWNADVLTDFMGDKRLTVAMREVEVDDGRGGKVKKAMPHVVTGEGATATAELLDAVVTRDYPGYRPALAATPASVGSPVVALHVMPPTPPALGAGASPPAVSATTRRVSAGAF